MSKHVHILLWVPLLYSVLFFILWVRIYQNEIISFEEYVLEKQANYAADSAIDELLYATHDTNMDYAEGDFLTLEPTLALDDYAHTLCLDYGYIPTETTLAMVKNKNIRTLVVCVYDGIYAFYPMKTETNAYELKQTPKIPYFYTSEDGTQYCLTLNPDKGYWDSGDANTYKLNRYDTYAVKPSDDIQATAINDKVADILNWALTETYTNDKMGNKVFIPAISDTVRGNQPVSSPTVIGVVDGNRKVFSTSITAECIGGSQLETSDHVIGYTLKDAPIYPPYTDDYGDTYYGDDAINAADDNGVHLYPESLMSGKYYAYESWWRKHSYLRDIPYCLSDGKSFDSAFEAASNGYNDLNLCN